MTALWASATLPLWLAGLMALIAGVLYFAVYIANPPLGWRKSVTEMSVSLVLVLLAAALWLLASWLASRLIF